MASFFWQMLKYWLYVLQLSFLRAKAATALVCLSRHDSVCPSVTVRICLDQSKMVQDKITKSLPFPASKTLVSGSLKLFHKFDRGHPEQGH